MAIARFTLVKIYSGEDGKPAVLPWSPGGYEQPGLSTTHRLHGVTTTESAVGDQVATMTSGYLRGVTAQNSETWEVGDMLWAKSDGSITHTRPAAPLPIVHIGTVFEDEGGGTFAVDVNVYLIPSIAELSGVSLEEPVSKDAFIYNAATHVWEPRQLEMEDLGDVDLTGAADGDVLVWDSSSGRWIASPPPSASVAALDDIGDVDVPAPDDGDVLVWDSSSGRWINAPAAEGPGALALNDLTDVDTTGVDDGYVLAFDEGSGEWKAVENSATVAALDDIGDVNAPSPGDGDVLTFDSGASEWVATEPSSVPTTYNVDVQTFTTPGDGAWTKPTDFTPKWVLVRIWGAGGGGGGGGCSSSTTKRYGGGAAGGGAHNEYLFLASELNAEEDLHVGTGGPGGAGATGPNLSGQDGTNGEASTFGDGVRLYAGGGGAGPGAGYGGGTAYCGGGGGGTAGNGTAGSSAIGLGGMPVTAALTSPTYHWGQTGGGGGNGGYAPTYNGSWAEHGGGGGGSTVNTPGSSEGGNSMYGGGGGGGGGSVDYTPAVVVGKPGGGSGVFGWTWSDWNGDGGAAGNCGASPTAGGDGANGGANKGGGGGGGGGSSATADTSGAAGGNGGTRGGGGGGGGAGSGPTAGFTGGDGGDGGRGEIVVISY